MAYPTFEQYNVAFHAHQSVLSDPELRGGVVAKTGLGGPLAISGGFALTYTVTTGTKKYAVRCFHKESRALERRYQAIDRRLTKLKSKYFLEFAFQPRGISVDGAAYPIVKMAWASGETLGQFFEARHGEKQALSNLATSFLSLSSFLERERIAHGDLQTGNVMVASRGTAIQLIDYDGMFVEEIRDLGSAELGHVNFQHPERKSKNPFGPLMDRFSLLVLSTAITVLQEDPSLWDKTKSEADAIVFRASDFVTPASSPIFAAMAARPSLGPLAKKFASVCASPIEKTPSLEDFLAGRNIPSVAIRLAGKLGEGAAKPGYIGVYDVLSAADYAACLRRVGDKVEVIGLIVEVKVALTRNGDPYVFINFGDWQGNIFKIAIWSEGLQALSHEPSRLWVGQWIGVVGLMEPPFVSRRHNYSHLSINVTGNGQMAILSAADARWRLTSSTSSPPHGTSSSNKDTLGKITGRVPSGTPVSQRGSLPSTNRKVLDNIRKAQSGSSGVPSVPPRQPTGGVRPSGQHAPSVKPEKSLVSRLFDWIFR